VYFADWAAVATAAPKEAFAAEADAPCKFEGFSRLADADDSSFDCVRRRGSQHETQFVPLAYANDSSFGCVGGRGSQGEAILKEHSAELCIADDRSSSCAEGSESGQSSAQTVKERG
jgi:hypothetical protein